MEDSNATHPNAYRVEAQEKLKQAAALQQEAEVLEAKANELEGVASPPAEAKAEAEPKEDKKLFKK